MSSGFQQPLQAPPPAQLSILSSLRGRTVLLTGATGFLGKIVLEKILRCAPDVGQVLLLVRPRKGSSAEERMYAEVISSEVFNRLRSEIGQQAFEERVKAKVRALPGELTLAEIGLTPELLSELYPRLNFVIHSAAVVDFNERLDRAVELNTLGSLRLLEIAKRCKAFEGFVHVSTAYVNSNRRGWVEEKLYPLGYDPDELLARVREMKEGELDKIAGSGLLRDWPNTYTFTKAMTEHLLEKRRAHVPLVIVRPSIIGSSWREPVPGWVDCITAAGAVYMSCGLGILNLIPGQMDHVSDLIPADTVTNAILAALASTAASKDASGKPAPSFAIMHSTSSTENTMHWGEVMDCVVEYFKQHPPKRRVGAPSMQIVSSAQLFQLLFFLKYSIPSALLNTLAPLGTKTYKENAQLYNKLVWRARVIIESFRHFTENQWSFHNARTRALDRALLPAEREIFGMNLAPLEWVDYNWTFCFGLCKYFLRMDSLIEPDLDDPSRGRPRLVHVELNKSHYYRASPQMAQIRGAAAGNEQFIAEQTKKYPTTGPFDLSFSPSLHEISQRLFVDLHWQHLVLNQRSKLSFGILRRSRDEMLNLVLNHPELARVMSEIVDKGGVNLGPQPPTSPPEPKPKHALKQAEVEARARAIAEKMFGETNIGMIGSLGYAFKKIWRKLYESIAIEKSGLEELQRMTQEHAKTSFIYLPTHRSYIDFLIISYLAYACKLPLPHIAAGEDFLGILLVRWMFRNSGAFFIRRSFLDGARSVDGYLYLTIFELYVRTLLCDGQSIEFYPEGTRSRSGKMLHPKIGMLQTITDMHLNRQAPNVFFVPIAINYEKTIEGSAYSSELLGENKIKENLKGLLKSSSKFVGGRTNFGTISVVIRKPISLAQYAEHYAKNILPAEAARVQAAGGSATPAPGPNFLVPASPAAAAAPASAVKPNPTATIVDESNGSSSASGSASSSSPALIPAPFRRHFNQTLAYQIVYEMQQGAQVMPTHLVATLMLMYRQGITRSQLVAKVDWLRREVQRRGGHTHNFATHDRTEVVNKAVQFLEHVIVQRRAEILEPAINSRLEYGNMLVLGHYRNKIVHFFFREGIVACALYALMDKQEQAAAAQTQQAQMQGGAGIGGPTSSSAAALAHSNIGIRRSALLSEVRFLFNLLQREFIYTNEIPDRIDSERVSEQVLDGMLSAGIFKQTPLSDDADALIEVAVTGETHFSFLCALIWPFIDSYYAAAMVLFSLQHSKKMEETQLLQRTQWLATTLYHESMLCFYESCSMDTLRNAFDVYARWQIVAYEKVRSKAGSDAFAPSVAKTFVSLRPPYASEEAALQQLITKINFLRKPPPVNRNPLRRNLIADLPIMAKL